MHLDLVRAMAELCPHEAARRRGVSLQKNLASTLAPPSRRTWTMGVSLRNYYVTSSENLKSRLLHEAGSMIKQQAYNFYMSISYGHA